MGVEKPPEKTIDSQKRGLIKPLINNVCPGAFKTDRAIELMLNESKRTNKPIEEIEKNNVSNLPLKRYQTPEELGDIVAFLASDLAKGVTGTTIQIDGGITRSLF